MKRPYGVTLVGYFYLLGAIVLLFTLGVQQDVGINERFGVPYLPEIVVRISVALVSIIMAYGYLNLRKWGYWAMVVYSVIFFGISINQFHVYRSQPFIGNMIFSIIVIFYTFINRRSFHQNG